MKKVVRIDKYISHVAGISRREIKKLLQGKGFTVNGHIVTDPAIKIDYDRDIVYFEGKALQKDIFVYYLLNKPKGVVSTVSDELGRETVVSLIDTHKKIYPVGRLDRETHGLILLTDDGELTHKLIHPRYHVPKTYRLLIAGPILEKQVQFMRKGIKLSDGMTLPSEIDFISESNEATVLQMVIYEGKYRQVRRMCSALGLQLLDLERIAFGPLHLENLKEGTYRGLSDNEVIMLNEVTQKSS